MASIYQRGNVYWIKYYVGKKRKEESLRTDSLQIAKEKQRQFESAQVRGCDNPLPSRTPIAAVVADYVKHIRTIKTAKSAQTDVYYLREAFGPICDELKVTSRTITDAVKKRPRKVEDARRSVPVIEATHFEAITTAEVSQFIGAQVRSKGLAPKTANRYREILHRLFAWSMKERAIRVPGGRNPVTDVERYTERAPEIRYTSAQNSQFFKDYFDEYAQVVAQLDRIKQVEATLRALLKDYADFGGLFRDLENAKAKAGSTPDVFERYFLHNLADLVTWQVPSRFVIRYRAKELQHHSLGQRASALILYVLSQRQNDVIIIDQPEDDLDNQTIYDDVIKLIRQMKPFTQFIFATHNANFPVLGDAEQVHACRYEDGTMSITSGSIDSRPIRDAIISIMEGGEEAFNKRKEVYNLWNPQSSSK